MKYKKLFEPIQISNCWIKNRIALAPMNLASLSNEYGGQTQRASEYYIEFAKGGVGLIISGVFKVENEVEKLGDRGYVKCGWPLLVAPKTGQIYQEMMQRIHAYGSKMFFQLSGGPGRNSWWPGYTAVSSSAVSVENNPGVTARALKTEEVEKIVASFAEAAKICYMADVDGIEIHGHEGYLIDQFMTKEWNHRTDKYGGSAENMARFPNEILYAIKDAVGKNYPVEFRMSLKHFIKSGPNPDFKYGKLGARPWNPSLHRTGYDDLGRDVDESMEMIKLLAEAGYDGFHIDAGCHESFYWAHPPGYFGRDVYSDYAEMVKKVVNVPVIAVGRLGDPDICLDILEKGRADMVAMGRDLLADPYWPKKVQEGRIEDIRPCLGCQEGCLGGGKYLSCQVNPVCGREILYAKLTPTIKKKRIMIVGGGIAGMEAARVATIRGHDVTVYEKTEKLGGNLIPASIPKFKADFPRLLEWYKVQLKKLNIKVKFNTQVTVDMIRKENADSVILATGSSPIIPKIPGIKGSNVVTCIDLLLNEAKKGKAVVILGGGSVGCETALWLERLGNTVTVIEMISHLAVDMSGINRIMLLDLLEESKVQICVNTTVLEITKDNVITIDKNFNKQTIKCDIVAVAAGMKAENDLYRNLIGEMSEIYAIGDCFKPRRIQQATFDGYTIAMDI